MAHDAWVAGVAGRAARKGHPLRAGRGLVWWLAHAMVTVFYAGT